jgi:hypothetical protein
MGDLRAIFDNVMMKALVGIGHTEGARPQRLAISRKERRNAPTLRAAAPSVSLRLDDGEEIYEPVREGE